MEKIAFLDTSVALRYILDEPHPYPSLAKFEKLYAVELLRVEIMRAIDRLRIERRLPDDEVGDRIQAMVGFMARVDEVPLQRPILQRAALPFPAAIGTLDAIHLAAAQLTQESLDRPLLFLTHDRRQGIAAQAAGLTVEGF